MLPALATETKIFVFLCYSKCSDLLFILIALVQAALFGHPKSHKSVINKNPKLGPYISEVYTPNIICY